MEVVVPALGWALLRLEATDAGDVSGLGWNWNFCMPSHVPYLFSFPPYASVCMHCLPVEVFSVLGGLEACLLGATPHACYMPLSLCLGADSVLLLFCLGGLLLPGVGCTDGTFLLFFLYAFVLRCILYMPFPVLCMQESTFLYYYDGALHFVTGGILYLCLFGHLQVPFVPAEWNFCHSHA
jgi:hypothetical protein